MWPGQTRVGALGRWRESYHPQCVVVKGAPPRTVPGTAELSEWQLSSDSEHNQEAGSEKGTEANPLPSSVTNLLCQGPGSGLYIAACSPLGIHQSL